MSRKFDFNQHYCAALWFPYQHESPHDGEFIIWLVFVADITRSDWLIVTEL